MSATISELAYTAGILDGEGHFSIAWNKPLDRFSGIVGVTNTNLDLLSWLKGHFGGFIYQMNTPPTKTHWKPRYTWRIQNTHTVPMLIQIIPFLIIKKRHAEIMIEFRSTYACNRSRWHLINNPGVLAKRRYLREELVILNDSHRAADAIPISIKIAKEREEELSRRHHPITTSHRQLRRSLIKHGQLDFKL